MGSLEKNNIENPFVFPNSGERDLFFLVMVQQENCLN